MERDRGGETGGGDRRVRYRMRDGGKETKGKMQRAREERRNVCIELSRGQYESCTSHLYQQNSSYMYNTPIGQNREKCRLILLAPYIPEGK